MTGKKQDWLTRRTTLKTVAGATAIGGGSGLVTAGSGEQAERQVTEVGELYEETITSVVTVRGFDQQGDRSTGSGWVYRVDETDAFVVTNWHVVANTIGADVRTSGGEWRPVSKLVGLDPYSDLAVLRVRDVPEHVTSLEVVDSPPERGTGVAAFGSPLGLEGSVTTGIVSGRNRSPIVGFGGSVYAVTGTVQTDAAINPGNSGGPLVDGDGRVVGTNFAGVQFFVGENVNFAVSAAMVSRAVPEIIETGAFVHPYLGIRGVTLSPTISRLNGIDEITAGVLVESTVTDYPASDALAGSTTTDRVTGVPIGGDVVVAVDGAAVGDTDSLQHYLFAETRPGDTIALTVLRDGSRRDVDLTLAEKPFPFERLRGSGPSM